MEANHSSEVSNWHQNFGWLFDFRKRCAKIDCYVGCVENGPVLLEPNVVHVIIFNFWEQKFVEHGTVTLAIDYNGGFLLIFEEKCPNDATVLKCAPNSHSLWMHRLFNLDFLSPKSDNVAYWHSLRCGNELHLKRSFFGKNAHLRPSDLQPIGRTENASDGHEASVLRLFELCRPSYQGFYGKFPSEKCEKCSLPENDDELMLMF